MIATAPTLSFSLAPLFSWPLSGEGFVRSVAGEELQACDEALPVPKPRSVSSLEHIILGDYGSGIARIAANAAVATPLILLVRPVSGGLSLSFEDYRFSLQASPSLLEMSPKIPLEIAALPEHAPLRAQEPEVQYVFLYKLQGIDCTGERATYGISHYPAHEVPERLSITAPLVTSPSSSPSIYIPQKIYLPHSSLSIENRPPSVTDRWHARLRLGSVFSDPAFSIEPLVNTLVENADYTITKPAAFSAVSVSTISQLAYASLQQLVVPLQQHSVSAVPIDNNRPTYSSSQPVIHHHHLFIQPSYALKQESADPFIPLAGVPKHPLAHPTKMMDELCSLVSIPEVVQQEVASPVILNEGIIQGGSISAQEKTSLIFSLHAEPPYLEASEHRARQIKTSTQETAHSITEPGALFFAAYVQRLMRDLVSIVSSAPLSEKNYVGYHTPSLSSHLSIPTTEVSHYVLQPSAFSPVHASASHVFAAYEQPYISRGIFQTVSHASSSLEHIAYPVLTLPSHDPSTRLHAVYRDGRELAGIKTVVDAYVVSATDAADASSYTITAKDQAGSDVAYTIRANSALAILDRTLHREGLHPLYLLQTYVDSDDGSISTGLIMEGILELDASAKEAVGKVYAKNIGMLFFANRLEPEHAEKKQTPLDQYCPKVGEELALAYVVQGMYKGDFSRKKSLCVNN